MRFWRWRRHAKRDIKEHIQQAEAILRRCISELEESELKKEPLRGQLKEHDTNGTDAKAVNELEMKPQGSHAECKQVEATPLDQIVELGNKDLQEKDCDQIKDMKNKVIDTSTLDLIRELEEQDQETYSKKELIESALQDERERYDRLKIERDKARDQVDCALNSLINEIRKQIKERHRAHKEETLRGTDAKAVKELEEQDQETHNKKKLAESAIQDKRESYESLLHERDTAREELKWAENNLINEIRKLINERHRAHQDPRGRYQKFLQENRFRATSTRETTLRRLREDLRVRI